MMRFDRFTESAQEAAQRAVEILQRYEQNQIDTEHFLLALLEKPEPLLEQILDELGVPIKTLCERLDYILRTTTKANIYGGGAGQGFITPNVRRIIEQAYAESKLQQIDNTTDMSIRGVFQDYNFLIVRSDMRDAWMAENSPGGFKYYDGYASITCPREGMEWMIIPETLAVYLDPSDKFIIITNCNDYKVIAEFFEGIGEAVPTEATTEETTETQAPNPPEFYDEYESVVYLRENINEDMSLLDIINVVDESCKYTRDEDMDMFNLEFGTFNYSTYDHYADEHVDLGKYYCFCMERWFTAEDGHDYIIYVSVLYEVNDTNKDYKHVRMTDFDIPKDCSDFFDYLRKSYSYDYASTEDIARIDIYMIDTDSY